MKCLECEARNNSILPQLIYDYKLEKTTEVIVCDSISGGKRYKNNMPKELSLIRTLDDNTEYRAEYKQLDTLSGSEALYGFCAWLTSRKKITKMGSTNDCGIIADLIKTFCDTNNLEEPRDNWNGFLTHPKE